VKRAFDPVKIILRAWDGCVYAAFINDGADAVEMDFEYGYVSYDGKVRDTKTDRAALPSHSRSVTFSLELPAYDPKDGIIFIRPLTDAADIALLRSTTPRERRVPSAPINTTAEAVVMPCGEKGLAITVSSDVFCHAVHFEGLQDAKFSDLYFDLLPGQEKTVLLYDCDVNMTNINAVGIVV
jgi:beta-mannosidase